MRTWPGVDVTLGKNITPTVRFFVIRLASIISFTYAFRTIIEAPSREKTYNSHIYGKKGADQLCSNCTADQRFYFRYSNSAIFFLLNPQFQALGPSFKNCTHQFLSNLVGNTDIWFSPANVQTEDCSP